MNRAGFFMPELRHRLSRLAILVALSLVTLALAEATPANAQERAQHRTLFDLLFGNYRKAPQPSAPAQTPKRKSTQKKSQSSIINIETAKPEEPAQKLDTAKHVLVIGDFMAGSVADGLAGAFVGEPGVAIDQRTDGASGLVRNDHYDWIATLPGLIDEIKPAAVIVALGSNDRQKMLIDGTREEFHTDKWTTEYERRISALTQLSVKRQVPLLWIGAPPFQSSSLTADIVTINLTLRRQVEAAGGTFIDIWEGFVDADGKFTATGSDVDGQQARLRGSDGVSLTKAGRAKAAFYVEKPLRRILGDTSVPLAANPPISDYGLPDLTMPTAPEQTEIVRTEPISMTDPTLDGGNALAAASPASRPGALIAPSPRDRLVLHGDPGTPPAGRVDSYKLRTN
jgi:uncharacterized protein